MSESWTERERELLARWTPLEPPSGFTDRVLGVRTASKAWIYAGIAAGAVLAAAAVLVLVWSGAERSRRGYPPVAPAVGPVRSGSDLVIPIGETLTVHDADGVVAIRFDDGGLCTGGMRIHVAADPELRAAREVDAAITLTAGTWWYLVDCSLATKQDVPPMGTITVVRDAATRLLPVLPTAPVEVVADGRTVRIAYAARPPAIAFASKLSCGRCVLHVRPPGRGQQVVEDIVIDVDGPRTVVPGDRFARGEYAWWFERGPERDEKSRLIVEPDDTVAPIEIDEPRQGDAWSGSDVRVRGRMLPGWALADLTHGPTAGGTICEAPAACAFDIAVARAPDPLVLRFTHAERGKHYYIRRSR